MRRILIKFASASSAALVSLAFIAVLLLFGLREAIGVAVAGLVAALDFIAIIWLATELLEPMRAPKSKVGLGFLLVGKLGFVAIILWAVITKLEVSPVGVVAGIGAAILGFTWGLSRASASKEGQAAIEAEEQRIREELERKGQ